MYKIVKYIDEHKNEFGDFYGLDDMKDGKNINLLGHEIVVELLHSRYSFENEVKYYSKHKKFKHVMLNNKKYSDDDILEQYNNVEVIRNFFDFNFQKLKQDGFNVVQKTKIKNYVINDKKFFDFILKPYGDKFFCSKTLMNRKEFEEFLNFSYDLSSPNVIDIEISQYFDVDKIQKYLKIGNVYIHETDDTVCFIRETDSKHNFSIKGSLSVPKHIKKFFDYADKHTDLLSIETCGNKIVGCYNIFPTTTTLFLTALFRRENKDIIAIDKNKILEFK